MARWQSRDDEDDDVFDDDPVDTDMDDSADASFDETPLPDPDGPGLLAVVGMWLILGLPLAFLAVMAAAGLARGEYDTAERLLAGALILAATGIGAALWGYTKRYFASRE